MKHLPVPKNYLLEANLEEKIKQTKRLIMDWYYQFDGKVYVAFSGGKDSTVLLHLVRSLFPDVVAVFANTGLEYPEIVEFVKTIDNVEILRPKKTFKQVLDEYGFPIISKNVSMAISRARNTKSEEVRDFRLNGKVDPITGKKKTIGTIPKKWKFIYDSDIKVTDRCCDFFKKQPFKIYERRTNKKPMIGSMAGESMNRRISYNRDDCNAFNAKNPRSTPIAFWNEDDIYKYIRDFDVEVSKIYSMGEKRTGCIFCMYGLHHEIKRGDDRFSRMQKTHPKLFTYCMDKLGLREVIKVYTGKEYDK